MAHQGDDNAGKISENIGNNQEEPTRINPLAPQAIAQALNNRPIRKHLTPTIANLIPWFIGPDENLVNFEVKLAMLLMLLNVGQFDGSFPTLPPTRCD
ncbi:hypothetical protein V6N13_056999 [Hibiscus sabdariffa]